MRSKRFIAAALAAVTVFGYSAGHFPAGLIKPANTITAEAANIQSAKRFDSLGYADDKNATPAQISLAWLICKKPYIVPIPGTRKLGRLTENLGAADVVLIAQEIAEIDKALIDMEMSDVFGGAKIVKKQ